MFSVIISEKGGAERREAFDRTEINVGRVQGNDLMLPKGNVSKRHARLLFRDGRFIVTDLKSTNGTYVNGRKIAQATIVREGDKIYIGDFVLRIETGSQSSAGLQGPTAPQEEIPAASSSSSPLPVAAQAANTSANLPISSLVGAVQPAPYAAPEAAAKQPPAPPPLPAPAPAQPPLPVFDAAPRPPPLPAQDPGFGPLPPVAQNRPIAPPAPQPSSSDPPSSQQPSSVEKVMRAQPAARIEPKTGDRHEVISHFPLEHDPDESVHYAVPGPPRVPSAPRTTGGSRPLVPPGYDPGAPVRPATTLGGMPQAGPPLPPGARVPAPEAPVGPAPPPIERPTSPSLGVPGLTARPGPILAARPAALPQPSPAPQARPGTQAFPPPIEPPPSQAVQSVPATMGPRGGTAESSQLAPAGERPSVDPLHAAAHRTALFSLVERVGELVDLRPLSGGAVPDEAIAARIDRALAEAAASLRSRGDLDVDALVVEARRELCEHGPLTLLFDDEDVTEIQVVRHDYVVALQGRRQVPSDVGFTSEVAVSRVIRRLCLASGRPLTEGETFVERRLPRGARLFAVLPSAEGHGHMVVIRKPQRADLTLEDLVRSGTISRAMAGLFAQCVTARANILVTGAVGAGTTSLIGALAAAGSTDDRVIVLQEDDELIFNQPHTISILLGDTPEEGARAVQAAARVRPDRLVVGAFAGRVAAEVVDAMGDGVDGVLAAARAPTLRQAVIRLSADLAATKSGVAPDVAREWLTSVFDIAIEIARLPDGRHRVLRVAEIGVEGARAAVRDVFTFAIERTAAGGAIEGSFYATGVVPGIIEDLAARGVPFDLSIFKRHSKLDAPPR